MARVKIGILTSSRADYGIYQPLISSLAADTSVALHLIVFGMHLLKRHGNTIDFISKEGVAQLHEVKGMPESDDIEEVARGYGELVKEFSDFWSGNTFDKVVALGDRFEMSAAVQASIPYEIPLAHIHGGETTLGATDNIYRHQITLASKLHFVATRNAYRRVEQITGSSTNIWHVGALSLDGIEGQELPDWEEVAKQFHIPSGSFILITVHPETVSVIRNKSNVVELEEALTTLAANIHLVITLTNADAMGSLFINMAKRIKAALPDQVSLIDNFGRDNYFAAMRAATMLLGNTSSGILEAASFHKYVVNLGDRQKGRLQSNNVYNVPFDSDQIIWTVKQVCTQPVFNGENIYYKPDTATNIHRCLLHESISETLN